MLPIELSAQKFSAYPPQAQKMAIRNLDTLRTIPLPLLAAILREMITLDWRFPAERQTLDAQCTYLASLSVAARADLLRAFTAIVLPSEMSSHDWVNHPQQFLEEMTAQLWASHQMDAFHAAADNYAAAIRAGAPDPSPAIPRLAVAILNEGVHKPGYPLFRKLRPHGVYFPQATSEGGVSVIFDCIRKRATDHPSEFNHWFIDGSEDAQQNDNLLSQVSWTGSFSVREAILQQMHAIIASGTGGPEMLRTRMAEWAPSFVSDSVLERFTRSVYAEGSGTQIFSTVFAEWAARESLRHAQPLTLAVRFGPRQRQQPMNVMLTANSNREESDPEGSLVDADMSAYYTWINLTRLSGSEQSRFLAWSQAHNQAIAIGPGLPRGTESAQPMSLVQLLKMITEA
jgi:hypothetical protein